MSTLTKFIKNNFVFMFLIAMCFVFLFITVKMNIFRYNNFDFGKFDLGNMAQMTWYTLHGKFMYLTDYFGTNLPRWAMSHVDPILVLFVPIFAIFPHPLTLVISQLVLVIFSALILYKIAELKLESKVSALFLSLAFLSYPALGFILSWTGYHGITVAIPFFLAAFYMLDMMCKTGQFNARNIAIFWIFSIITLSGKEEISLFFIVFGIYTWFFRKRARLGSSILAVGIVWFIATFFVIIPAYSGARIDGYTKFAVSLGIDSQKATDVRNSNFFLSRYEEFGDDYLSIATGMISNPKQLIRVVFGGDKLENLNMTLAPLGYMPLIYPPILAISIPEFLINYATTAGGIGTSEIYNHRISLIIPVLFLATLYAIYMVSSYFVNNRWIPQRFVMLTLSFFVLLLSIYTSFKYQNPIHLWTTQAVKKRLPQKVLAKEITIEEDLTNIQLGDRLRFSPLEDKDRECALRIVNSIPDLASVSGPDHLGAHLSLRETYAIFPALFDKADYVIVDVFAEKVARVLGVERTIIRDVTKKVVIDDDYKLTGACGNLFVFKRIGPHGKSSLLPLQEKFEYDEKVSYEIFQTLTVVDYKLPTKIKKEETALAEFVYSKKGNDSLDGYVLFLTFINSETKDAYQFANLPSFSLSRLNDWSEGHYFTEKLEIIIPDYLEGGQYKVFIGMDNKIRTRSIYLGDVSIY